MICCSCGIRDMGIYLRAGLGLLNMQPPVANVLTAHLHDIAPTLSGVQQQCERQSRPRTNRMRRFELPDLFLSP